MTTTDDSSFFGETDDYRDWLDWGEDFVSAVLIGSQRIGLAITAAGFAIAGSNMIEGAPALGQASLGAAGVFGLWVAVASVKSVGAIR